MDILALFLAGIIVTFIIQLLTSVTMIATVVVIIIISIRTIILGRVIVTATEIHGSQNRISTHTKIYKKIVLVVITA